MKKLIGTLILLCMSGVVLAKDIYMVNAKIHYDDMLLDSPILGVESNKKGSVSVTNSYDFSILVNEQTENTVFISVNLKLKDKELNPVLVVELGKEASIEVGKIKLTIVVFKAST